MWARKIFKWKVHPFSVVMSMKHHDVLTFVISRRLCRLGHVVEFDFGDVKIERLVYLGGCVFTLL